MKKKVKRVQMRYEIIFSAHGSFIVSYCWRLSFCFVKLGCRNMNRLIEDIKIAHLAQLLIIILRTHVLTLHREMSLVSLGKPTVSELNHIVKPTVLRAWSCDHIVTANDK